MWFVDTATGEEVAVVMLMGDKTTQASHWYPTQVEAIETLLIPSWEHHHPKPQGDDEEDPMTKPSLPEPVIGGQSAQDFATSTERVKAARSKLLRTQRASDAHATLGELIAERLDVKKATLGELRRALGLTQTQLAEMLDLGQGDISRLERRRNLYLNTLARFVEATGGHLRITAVYGDTEVTLDLRDEPGDSSLPPEDGSATPKTVRS